MELLRELGVEIPESFVDTSDPHLAHMASLYFTLIQPSRAGDLTKKPRAWWDISLIGDEVYQRAQLKALKKKPKVR